MSITERGGSSLGALLMCLRQASGLGILKQKTSDQWKGVLPWSVLTTALCHRSEQVWYSFDSGAPGKPRVASREPFVQDPMNYVHPTGGWTYYFCFVRRPASHLVSRHFRQQFLSYLYQIWHAGLLG